MRSTYGRPCTSAGQRLLSAIPGSLLRSGSLPVCLVVVPLGAPNAKTTRSCTPFLFDCGLQPSLFFPRPHSRNALATPGISVRLTKALHCCRDEGPGQRTVGDWQAKAVVETDGGSISCVIWRLKKVPHESNYLDIANAQGRSDENVMRDP